MQNYTVLLRFPDDIANDQCCAADTITRQHTRAFNPELAIETAIDNALRSWELERDPSEFAPVAVYEGHLFDLLEV